ncbi:MAG: serpin family protein [Peptostreptococcaceae bacterium]|nr:serpin family protein [Peptostreptococcaceae bacterium]
MKKRISTTNGKTQKALALLSAIMLLMLAACAPNQQSSADTKITSEVDAMSIEIFNAVFESHEKENNLVLSPLSIQRLLDLMALATDERADLKTLSVYDENHLENLNLANSKMESLILINKAISDTKPELSFKNIKITEFPKQATKEKINLQKRVLDEVLNEESISAESVLVLLDAIQYYAEWTEPFDTALTADADFTTFEKKKISVPTMSKKFDSLNYWTDDEKEIAQLDGKNDAKVYFIKPKKDIEKLDLAKAVSEFKENANNGEVLFKMPKIEYKLTSDLKEMFEKIGLGKMLVNYELEKLLPGVPLKITSATQTATLKIDEKGARAKAVTEIQNEAASALDEPTEIKMDSPYYIVMTDVEKNTGESIITFVCYIADPSQKEK